jgi:hypothetical protein
MDTFKEILAQLKLIASVVCSLGNDCKNNRQVLMYRLDSEATGQAKPFTQTPGQGVEGQYLTYTKPYKYLSITFLKGTPEDSRVEVNDLGYISGSNACAEGYGTSIPDFPLLQSDCYKTPITIKAFDGAKIEVMIII